jgi:hypothetical protein
LHIMSDNIQSATFGLRYQADRDLRALICVREPYFALRGLIVAEAEVQANIAVEQPVGRERGVIAAAEAGRHLAILGACALARVNPVRERHYYLATNAVLSCVDPMGTAGIKPLVGRATAFFESKRKGRAHCVLLSWNGGQLFDLEVGYAVLTESVFERLFAGARLDSAHVSERNPHARPLPLTGLAVRDRSASFLLPCLDANMCTGHFEGYPLLPVAIVMRTLSDLAGALLQYISGSSDVTYVVQRAEVEAHNFAKPSEALLFEAEYMGSNAANQHSFVCHASVSGGAQIGTLRLILAS